MSVILLRSLILYFLVIFSVRLMGKRQLGELQPSELVITILVSNIATLPLEDTDIPLLTGVTPILCLVCYEVLMSWLILRFPRLRKIVSGTPKIIISGGRIDRSVLKELRFSADDLMTAMRGQQIFDIAEVQYAIVETTGSVSFMKKQEKDAPDRSDMGIGAAALDPPQVVISDGRIIHAALRSLGVSESFIKAAARDSGLSISEIFIMTADSDGGFFIAPKNGGEPVIGGKV